MQCPPDPDNFDQLRLKGIKEARDEVWELQEKIDKLGVPEASDKLEECATLLTEEIDFG